MWLRHARFKPLKGFCLVPRAQRSATPSEAKPANSGNFAGVGNGSSIMRRIGAGNTSF